MQLFSPLAKSSAAWFLAKTPLYFSQRRKDAKDFFLHSFLCGSATLRATLSLLIETFLLFLAKTLRVSSSRGSALNFLTAHRDFLLFLAKTLRVSFFISLRLRVQLFSVLARPLLLGFSQRR